MDTGKNYEFILQENPREVHDYFLQDYIPSNGERYFSAKLLKKQKCKVSVFFVVLKGALAISIENAPFGGFRVEKRVTSDSFQFFIGELLLALKSMGVTELKVVQPPEPYEQNTPLINYMLKKLGFEVVDIDLHHFLEDKKFIKGFLYAKASKHKKKLKRLNYSVEVGGIKTFNFLKDIKWWVTLRGNEYLVPEEYLIRQVGEYPDRYHLVSIFQEEEVISHALCIKLTGNSLYYYLPAIHPNLQNGYTAEAMLFEVIKLGESLGVDFIDLGSSNLDGQANHELNRFKSRYANNSSNKMVWSIQLRDIK